MEQQTALHIIRALAQGIDPHTGETFPADSPYQHPDTVRALFRAAEALGTAGRPQTPRSNAPENSGKPWTDEEDQRLVQAFDASQPLAELAKQHRRSRAAIQARLLRLGKIEPPEHGPRFWVAPATPATQ